MKRQIEGVAEKILECAEIEFLEKGFTDASLRDIAKNSGVSTSSIYTRFGDKEGLFSAVVAPVMDEFLSWFASKQEEFHQFDAGVQSRDVFLYSDDKSLYFTDYIYDHFNIFKLLVMKSEGTKFANFTNDFVEIEVSYTKKFLESTGSDVISSGYLSSELLHILSSAYYAGVFETVIHDMPRELAHTHVKKLRRFFMSGWKDMFGMT